MTHGSPLKLILSFMIPLFFGNIFQNLYSMVDAFGFTAACFASPLAWVAADCFLIPAYLHCIKRARREGSLI